MTTEGAVATAQKIKQASPANIINMTKFWYKEN